MVNEALTFRLAAAPAPAARPDLSAFDARAISVSDEQGANGDGMQKFNEWADRN
jgi:hypothetical protein